MPTTHNSLHAIEEMIGNLLSAIEDGNIEETRHILEDFKAQGFDNRLNQSYGFEQGFSPRGYYTPLKRAILKNNPEMVALLLEYGANPDFEYYFNHSALDFLLKDVITQKEKFAEYSDEDLENTMSIVESLCLKNSFFSKEQLNDLAILTEEILTNIEEKRPGKTGNHVVPNLETRPDNRDIFNLRLLKRLFFEQIYRSFLQAIRSGSLVETQWYLTQERFPFFSPRDATKVLCSINLQAIKDPNNSYHAEPVLEAARLRTPTPAILACLHEHGFSLTTPHKGATPLHGAALRGNVRTIIYLLKHGANRSKPNTFGYTADECSTDQNLRKNMIYYWPLGFDTRDSEAIKWFHHRHNQFTANAEGPDAEVPYPLERVRRTWLPSGSLMQQSQQRDDAHHVPELDIEPPAKRLRSF